MDTYEAAPRSADRDSADRPRPIPTPGDLWPRGVRREHGEDADGAGQSEPSDHNEDIANIADAELATGTG